MPRQHKSSPLRCQTRDAGRNVIACYVRVDDLDIILPHEVRQLDGAKNTERVSDGDVKNILRLKKRKAVPPVAARAQRDKYFVTTRVKAAAQIDDVALGAAKVSPG